LGFDGRDYVEAVELAENIETLAELSDRSLGEAAAIEGWVILLKRREQLDPEDGDGLVIATGRRVLAANGDVIGGDGLTHLGDRRRLAEAMNVAGAGEDVGRVRPARFRQGSLLECLKELVDLGLGAGPAHWTLILAGYPPPPLIYVKS
jgi:hypothetical protein